MLVLWHHTYVAGAINPVVQVFSYRILSKLESSRVKFFNENMCMKILVKGFFKEWNFENFTKRDSCQRIFALLLSSYEKICKVYSQQNA